MQMESLWRPDGRLTADAVVLLTDVYRDVGRELPPTERLLTEDVSELLVGIDAAATRFRRRLSSRVKDS